MKFKFNLSIANFLYLSICLPWERFRFISCISEHMKRLTNTTGISRKRKTKMIPFSYATACLVWISHSLIVIALNSLQIVSIIFIILSSYNRFQEFPIPIRWWRLYEREKNQSTEIPSITHTMYTEPT